MQLMEEGSKQMNTKKKTTDQTNDNYMNIMDMIENGESKV